MLHGHHFAVVRTGGDPQAVRHRLRRRGQGMIARYRKALRKPPEQGAVSFLRDQGLLSVHQGPGVGDRRAEGGADGLMPQTDPQQRNLLSEFPGRGHGDSRVLRPARTGGEDDPVRLQRPDFLQGHFIVPDHADVRIQLADELKQVIGKTVIIINQQRHPSISSPDCTSEFSTARALFRHSSCSFSGTES